MNPHQKNKIDINVCLYDVGEDLGANTGIETVCGRAAPVQTLWQASEQEGSFAEQIEGTYTLPSFINTPALLSHLLGETDHTSTRNANTSTPATMRCPKPAKQATQASPPWAPNIPTPTTSPTCLLLHTPSREAIPSPQEPPAPTSVPWAPIQRTQTPWRLQV